MQFRNPPFCQSQQRREKLARSPSLPSPSCLPCSLHLRAWPAPPTGCPHCSLPPSQPDLLGPSCLEAVSKQHSTSTSNTAHIVHHEPLGQDEEDHHHLHHSGHNHCCDLATLEILACQCQSQASPIPDGEDEVQIIEDQSLLSLFSGGTFLKGGSSTLLLVALVGAALYWMRKWKMRRLNQSSAPPPSPSPWSRCPLPPQPSTPFSSDPSMPSATSSPPWQSRPLAPSHATR